MHISRRRRRDRVRDGEIGWKIIIMVTTRSSTRREAPRGGKLFTSTPPPLPSSDSAGIIGGKIIVAVAVAFGVGSLLPSRELNVAPHMRQKAFFEPGLLSATSGGRLVELLKRFKDYPTNVNDVQFYKTEHEHIGEGTPLAPNGTCTDPFKVPNSDRTLCVLAGRIDVGRHYILTGGLQGAREPFEYLVSRVQSFGCAAEDRNRDLNAHFCHLNRWARRPDFDTSLEQPLRVQH